MDSDNTDSSNSNSMKLIQTDDSSYAYMGLFNYAFKNFKTIWKISKINWKKLLTNGNICDMINIKLRK